MRHFKGIAAAVVFLAAPAFAQQPLRLEIRDGRVNLDVSSVPARQILAEWARVGGTKVVGGDKVTGAPLTLKLVNMPERQALDIILRNVAGYMAAPRAASSAPGASAYDRILILATSTPAAAINSGARSPAASIPAPMAGTERRIAPRPPGMEFPQQKSGADDDPVMESEPDQADTGVNQQPVFTFPQPQVPGNQVFVPMPAGGFGTPAQPGAVQQPQITLQPNPNGQPTIYNFLPTSPAAPGPLPNPFTVIGSPTPGVVQQPAQPQSAQPPRKPPGH